MTRNDLRQALLGKLRTLPSAKTSDLNDEAHLITDGFLDSSALFELALWVEEQVGRPVDLTSFSLVDEWNSIPAILSFIEQRRAEERPA